MYRVISICVVIFISATGFAQNKLTLQQCIDTALANNIQLKQTDLQVQSAEINWRQTRANLLPNINAFANHGMNQGRSIDPFTNAYINQNVNYASYGINSSVVLFNGLSLQNSIKQYGLSYEASKMELQQAKDNLTLNVILAYLQVLNNEDLVNLAATQADVSRKQLDRLGILNKEGAISPSQYSDVKGQLMNDELAIINNHNAYETSKLTLAQLVSLPYDKNLQLERINVEDFLSTYNTTPTDIYSKALDQLALVKGVELRRKSAEAALKVVRGELYPSLVLGGNVNTNYSSAATKDILINTTDIATTNYVLVNGNQVPVFSKQSNYSSQKIAYNSQLNNNLFTSLNVSLRIPIFNSFLVKNRIKLAKLDIKNSELAEQNTKLQLRQQIEQAYLNMTNALDRYKALAEQVNAYAESFRAAEVKFNAGVGTSVDYIIAKGNLDRANINLVSAKYDFLLRKKVLDYYQSTISVN